MDSAALAEALRRLAANHRWTWTATCRDLLSSLPGAASRKHPYAVVSELGPDQLDALLAECGLTTRVSEEIEGLDRA
ncbi:MAG: hypothetical protein ACRDZM_09965, partial [Acidimicrobiia bacterium]